MAYGTAVVGPGADNILTTSLAGDDLYESINSIPPATDPTQRDTDSDGISDFIELEGFAAGLAIVDGGNGIADSSKNGDDIQRVFSGNPVFPDSVVILPGINQLIDSVASGDDRVRPAISGLVSDPLRRDTDADTFVDGLELRLGSNPTEFDGSDFIDSDMDGLSDREEDTLGWMVSANGAIARQVNSSPSLPDTDFDGLPDVIERDLRTDPNNQDTDGDGLTDYEEVNDLRKYAELAQLYPALDIPSSTGGLGTNPLLADSDSDGLSDRAETQEGFLLLIPGRSTASTFYTNPLLADTDLDGVNDGDEVNRGGSNPEPTDPTDPDTDDDNRNDDQERIAGSNPFVPDAVVTVRYTYLRFDGGDNEWDWFFYAQGPGARFPGSLVVDTREFATNSSYELVEAPGCSYISVGNFTTLYFGGVYADQTFVMKAGDAIVLSGSTRELDGSGGVCPDPDGPANVSELATFEKILTFEDIVGSAAGRTGSITTVALTGSATPSVGWELVVD